MIKMIFKTSTLLFLFSTNSFAVMNGAKALQIENDRKSFFQCVLTGFIKKTRQPANIDIKTVSKYTLKATDIEGNLKGVYFDLWGIAGFNAQIENGELVLTSEIDDEGAVQSLAFKKAPAFIEMKFDVTIEDENKVKRNYEKFSLDCFKHLPETAS